jgi:hypothetical protein
VLQLTVAKLTPKQLRFIEEYLIDLNVIRETLSREIKFRPAWSGRHPRKSFGSVRN